MTALRSVGRGRLRELLIAGVLIAAASSAWLSVAAAQSNVPSETIEPDGQLGISFKDRAAHIDPGYGGLEGALIVEVRPGSPADRAGLKVQDIVVRFDGLHIHDAKQLQGRIARLRPGQSAELEIERNSETKTITVMTGTRS